MARTAAPGRPIEALDPVRWNGSARPKTAHAPLNGLDEVREVALHQAITRTLEELPEPSLRLLAAMAVVNQETPLPILAVLADVADPSSALDDLVEAGFVDWLPHGLAERVGIDSRALRDVVYWNLPVPLRREMHRAAAEQVSGVHGFRHLLLGASRRDPELAARLEDEATRYHAAGDLERAGVLLLWSTDVSVDRRVRERRLLRAAEWGGQAPTAGWAAPLSERLAPLEPSVQRNLFLGRIAAREARFEAAQSLFDQALVLAADQPAPVRTAVELARAELYAETGDLEAAERVALAVLEQDALPAESRDWSVFFAADAHGRMHGSAQASLHRLEALAPELAAARGERPGHAVLWWARGAWQVQSGRPAEAVSDLQRVLRSHDGPVEPVLPLTYAYLGYALFQLGDWRAALYEAHEGIRLARSRNDQRAGIPGAALAACIHALRGEWSAAARRADSVAKLQRAAGPARYGVFPALAAAHLAQAQGDPGRMLTALAPVAAEPALFAQWQLWWRPLYAEALIEAGRLDTARKALAELDSCVAPEARPAAVMARLEARLMAAEGDLAAAIDLLARAVEHPSEADSPFSLAELEHDYGRVLLAARRRRSGTRWLRSAHDRYVDLGALPFAQRCLRQLTDSGVRGATGAAGGNGKESAAEADSLSVAALTLQERRIAELAVEGMTNQQIARVLFVSAKTIEYHLGNIFAKLGIPSRRQLRAALEASAERSATPN